MAHETLFQLTGILALGILAQWTSWRVRLPSILFLLTAGILAGPVTGWLHPDELFGDLMFPLVSLSVAVILYEGGLNLRLRELKSVGVTFVLLTTVGAAISWAIGAAAAHFILRYSWPVAALLGAILVVTGPTVIGPILRHLRLRGKVNGLLKWEGIIIDPLGAMLALLVFTTAQAETHGDGLGVALKELGLTLLIGMVAGSAAAAILILALSRYWIPDSLHNPVSLTLMFVAFTASNLIQKDSGLLTVTVMGIILANQKWVSIRHVIEFKETLTVLLISCLFIILAARLNLSDLRGLGLRSVLFVLILLFVGRPLSVLISTWRSPLTWQERAFLCCMAPRGIVAAAISSVFSASMVEAGYLQAVEIVPVTFLVVFMTVLIYGLAAEPLARWLGLIQANPQGVLFIGADAWVQALARAIQEEGFPVFLIDTDWQNIRRSRMAGLPSLHGSALAEETREDVNYTGLGRMLAVTSNNEVNSLACLRYAEDFGRQSLYQLPFSTEQEGRHEAVPPEHRGRFLFGPDLTFHALAAWAGDNPQIKKTKLTDAFDYKSFLRTHQDAVVPLLCVRPDGSLLVRTITDSSPPSAGDLVFSLVRGKAKVPSIVLETAVSSVPPSLP